MHVLLSLKGVGEISHRVPFDSSDSLWDVYSIADGCMPHVVEELTHCVCITCEPSSEFKEVLLV